MILQVFKRPDTPFEAHGARGLHRTHAGAYLVARKARRRGGVTSPRAG